MGDLDPSDRRQGPASEELLASDPLADLVSVADFPSLRRYLKSGAIVFRAGDNFNAIYVIRRGFFKTAETDGTGREQVLGFFMRSELLGLDGIGSGKYASTAEALEDSEVVALPFALLENLSRENREIQRQLHAVLSREIVRNQGVMLLLGSMTAASRIAAFLINLSMRLARRGCSPSEFVLRMTRRDIGSYLGLELETVSREFSKLHDGGLLVVQGRHVRILSLDRLRDVLQAGVIEKCPLLAESGR